MAAFAATCTWATGCRSALRSPAACNAPGSVVAAPVPRRPRQDGPTMKTMADVSTVGHKRDGDIIRGPVYVVGDNIDTDQIIPAGYLTLVPSVPEEYEKLGSYAMIGLPKDKYTVPFIEKGSMSTRYPIVIGGDNFGCGSSREHAPIAMGACGVKAVVASGYARIYYRNCSATGEIYPWETPTRLVDEFSIGDVAEINFAKETITNETTGKTYTLNPLGDVLPVVDCGGIFEFARQSGMIAKK
ncbi:hypothetical protein BU14_0141s0009 [Porphyra umbilicalis]|uniref:Aconitase A/isopropylmalate dehydratase small subunit swivel domain-containing protein n=1 Tax=Porphyra umbilicalis TaxID=2786 RepID=A0A1X6PA67_PORUM|nr:hypothetical protein BU14_0141s0009 [Porphyra umbilicalis]|eukprot:OSX77625.1 hypothetical protein BU14_0141s0009 [Porphyra umbilicalis]